MLAADAAGTTRRTGGSTQAQELTTIARSNLKSHVIMRVARVTEALRTLRDALAVEAPCVDTSASYDVADLVEPLPEAVIETAIQAAIDGSSNEIPKRATLEADLLRRGAGLATLAKGSGRYFTERPVATKPKDATDADLLLRFVLSDLDPKKKKRTRRTRAIFQVFANDHLDVLRDLVVRSCDEALVAGGAFRGDVSQTAFDFEPPHATRFKDLDLKLGATYTLSHGNCRHRLVFDDASLWTGSRPAPDRTAFRAKNLVPNVSCDVCDAATATMLVENDPRAPTDITLYCDPCLHMFHYDHHGHLLPTSKASADKPDKPLMMFPL